MIRRWLSIIALVLMALALAPLMRNVPYFAEPSGLAAHYLDEGPDELGGQNLVTSVIVTYRGLDTLGEVAVLFAATAGVGVLLRRRDDEEPARGASEILETGAGLLFPLILLLGTYIFLHGHLTPGGGFQGGVVIATGFLLLLLSGRVKALNHLVMNLVESVFGAAYLAVGVLGLVLAGGFLDPRFLPLGNFGSLLSAGAIPIIYSLIGLKVGAELTGILDRMKERS